MINSVFINIIFFIIIISSFFVIISKNTLHSILFLVICFFSSSIAIFLLQNEFLAFFFLIIYLGAIVVLFLFVVMMLDLNYNDLKLNRLHLPTGVLLGSFFFLIICFKVLPVFSKHSPFSIENSFYLNWFDLLDVKHDAEALGAVFYNTCSVQILIIGLLLYISVIGISFLTVNKYKNSNIKIKQNILKQLSRNNVL